MKREVALLAGESRAVGRALYPLISQSGNREDPDITYYQSNGFPSKTAEARSVLAYCYWREGRVNEARIMLHEALERLPPQLGLKRAWALLKLVDVEHSAARHYDELKILTDIVTFLRASHIRLSKVHITMSLL